MNSIALVSCVAKKQSQPSPAQELYQSLWFTKARAYVEQQGWDWYILSAKYGLLSRQEMVAPYEQTLKQMSKKERQSWANTVLADILQVFPTQGLVRIFAGIKYREDLLPLLHQAGYEVEVPLVGLGIGQQLAWFNSHLN